MLAAVRWMHDVLIASAGGLAFGLVSAVVVVAAARTQARRIRTLAEFVPSGTQLDRAEQALAGGQNDLLRKLVESAVADVADDQGLAAGTVRGSIFAPDDQNVLRIPGRLAVNFGSPEEATIRIRPGESGVGEAYESGQPVITIFRSPGEDSTIADPEERAKVDPALRWIVSVPVIALRGERPRLVLEVDGTQQRTAEQLHSAVGRLLYYREVVELLLKERASK